MKTSPATFPAGTTQPPVAGCITAGLVVLAVSFGGFATWSSLAPLSSAAVASGRITVDSHRKTVQHQEGGIIAELLVKEGDRVRAGQMLMRLEAVASGAQAEALDAHLLALLAEEARLVAQRDGLSAITFPATLERRANEAGVAEVLAGQRRIFEREREILDGTVEVLGQRIAQSRSQIEAHRAQAKATIEQLKLVRDEIKDVTALLEKGLERRPRLLQLERNAAALEGTLGELQGKIAAAEQTIGETKLRIVMQRQDHMREVSKQLRDVQTRRAEMAEKLRAAAAEHRRRDVVAPEDGIVLNLRHFAPGAVITPGGAVLDIVPENDRLLVEAKLSPADIDSVHPGLPAEVVLSGYKSRTTPRFAGQVTLVSADALTDERTGESYFNVRVEIEGTQLARHPDVKLLPGMPAETFIVTGERTALEYVVQPITDSLRRAFREE